MDATDHILTRVVSENPRDEAQRILTHLGVTHRARAAAVFLCNADGIELFVATELAPLEAVAEATGAWSEYQAALQTGRTVRIRQLALAPVRADEALVGLIALWNPQPLDPATLAVAQKHILRTIRTWRSVALSYVESTTLDAFIREKLAFHLGRTNWNVARVAEIMGVTRNTIYSWQRKYGLGRPVEHPE